MTEDIFKPDVALCDELEQHVVEIPPIGECLKHPLVFQVPLCRQMSYHLNSQLEQKQKQLKLALINKKWDRFIFWYERAYRWEALEIIADEVPDEEFWELFASVYVDTENWQEYPDLIEGWLEHRRNGLIGLMDSEERVAWAQLPDEIEVYRGWHRDGGEQGYSWSILRTVAHKFATRRRLGNEVSKVATGKVQKENILAFWNRRSEAELFVPIGLVKVLQVEEV